MLSKPVEDCPDPNAIQSNNTSLHRKIFKSVRSMWLPRNYGTRPSRSLNDDSYLRNAACGMVFVRGPETHKCDDHQPVIDVCLSVLYSGGPCPEDEHNGADGREYHNPLKESDASFAGAHGLYPRTTYELNKVRLTILAGKN